MPVIMRAWKWLLIVGVACAVLGAGRQVAAAEPSVLKETVLTRAMPGEVRQPAQRNAITIERLLNDTWSIVERGSDGQDPFALKIPWRTRQTAYKRWGGELGKTGQIPLPGFLSSSRLHSGRLRLASLGTVFPILSPRAGTLLDAPDTFASSGRLVGNPSALYAGFEILVNVRTYTLELYATRHSSKKELLYSCRVGLGSDEYPTPRGSYFVSIIYDDKPLWIPPPRDWAYGQEPSRSVYGGHMMPFFRKVAVPDKSEETVDHLDNVASPMKMVDTGTYRIHGTDSPWSIGSSQSHGCVRMLNKTVKQLADTLKLCVGTGSRGRSENGSYVALLRPVRLILY